MTLLRTELRDMAAKKRAEKGKRDDVAVKVDRTLADKAKLVASRRGITMAEYLSELIRTPVERDFSKTIREMGEGRAARDAADVKRSRKAGKVFSDEGEGGSL